MDKYDTMVESGIEREIKERLHSMDEYRRGDSERREEIERYVRASIMERRTEEEV